MTDVFMLDTNAVSGFMHGRSGLLDRRITAQGRSSLCLSCITYAETMFGLRNKPEATRLAAAAHALFDRVNILPWGPEAAEAYASLRAEMKRNGRTLQPLDMLIAAHAVASGAVLVSADKAFAFVPDLTVEDWTAA